MTTQTKLIDKGRDSALAIAKNDGKSIAQIREKCTTDPTYLAEVTRRMRRLSYNNLTRRMAGPDSVMEESFRLTTEKMRSDLCGPNPSATEKLLVEHIVLCWCAVQAAEAALAHNDSTPTNIQMSQFFQDRRDRTHRNYLAAVKTLATVRKLALPALQVNIAKKQVNVLADRQTG